MNVKTRDQFERVLHLLRTSDITVCDTETNGLKAYGGDSIISISLYFPHVDESYYLPFLHGVGRVEVRYTKSNPPEKPFEKMNWSGSTKKSLLLQRKIDALREQKYDWGNLPILWINDLKEVWGRGTWVFHNARFDLHMLHVAGFPAPDRVEDTMVNLHIVHEDWQGMRVTAPYKYSKKDGPKLAGRWARDAAGNLLKKEQPGNRQLKWVCAYLGFEGATSGEETLYANMEKFRAFLGDERIEIDEKKHMWLLPSDYVAEYAELDVRLTWQLRQWTHEVAAKWNNLSLIAEMNDVAYHVAWRMERNGFKLDRAGAEREIAQLEARMLDIRTIIGADVELGVEEDEEEEFNLNSNAQLLKFLNSGVLDEPWDQFPDWWPPAFREDLRTYPGVRLSGCNKEEFYKVRQHGLIRLIQEYRKMNKAASVYLSRWLQAADEDDIVRFSMNVDGTVSGRFSSSGDAGNGQNIPDRNGYTIKRAVIPYDDTWEMFGVDYSQLELRLAAWIAEGLHGFGRGEMSNLFINGIDPHAWLRDTAEIQQVLYPGMSEEAIVQALGYKEFKEGIVAKHCRYVAKTMNFGLLYSGTHKMLSKLLHIDEQVAEVLVRKWKRFFPAFEQAQNYYTELALRPRPIPNGRGAGQYVTQPISGRHRHVHKYPTWIWFEKNGIRQGFNPREATARKAWNSVVQGLGGYLCGMSALRYVQEYGEDDLKMFANIHDALDGYCRNRASVENLGRIMVDWPEIVPHLSVTISFGNNWQDLTETTTIEYTK